MQVKAYMTIWLNVSWHCRCSTFRLNQKKNRIRLSIFPENAALELTWGVGFSIVFQVLCNPIQLIKRQSCHQIETTQLICRVNQLTSFCMMATLAFNKLNKEVNELLHAEKFQNLCLANRTKRRSDTHSAQESLNTQIHILISCHYFANTYFV